MMWMVLKRLMVLDTAFKEEHASRVKVKPIGKVHTGRLSTKIEEEDEGYGGFCNALVYLLKGVVS